MFVIAGASGRTGARVVETLLRERQPVRALVRDPAAAEGFRARGADVRVVTLDDREGLSRALADASALYALIPEEPFVPDLPAHRRRIVASITHAVRTQSVPHVVLLSAGAAALSEQNGPCEVLHHAEAELRGVARLCALRACVFQENVAALDGMYFNFFGDRPTPWVAACDVAALAVQCLREPKAEIVDVIGPTYSARDIGLALEEVHERAIRVVDVPAHEHAATLARAGLPAAFAASLAELYACFARGRVLPCGDRLFTGGTSLQQTLRQGRGRS